MIKIASLAESSRATGWSREALRDFGAPLFVWGVWALMLLVALVFVGTYSVDVPFCDDFCYVPALTGDQPITLTWLWRQDNEHRNFVPKLILVGLYRLSHDFRAAMFFNVLALGALAFAMIWSARRLRGRVSYSDAFFPLALLHLGHSPNFLWSWQVDFVSQTVLAGMFLLVVVGGEAQSRPGAALLAGFCLVLLPLCGAAGLAVTCPLALWLGYIGIRYWRSGGPHGKRVGFLILGLVASSLLLVALYLRDLKRPAGAMNVSRLGASLQSSILFLGQGFGPAYPAPLEWVLKDWKVAQWVTALGVVGLMLLSVAALAAIIGKRSEDRPRALGLLLYLGAMAALALAIGYGRPGYGGRANRYAPMAVPALCAVYFAWSAYGRPAARFTVNNCLFLFITITFIFNFNDGINNGRYHKSMLERFRKDLAAGMPHFMLSGRYSPIFNPTTETSHDALAMLHRAGLGEFRHLRGDPAFREVPLPVASAASGAVTSEGGAARGDEADPSLVFTLPETTFVAGVRFRYSHPARGDSAPEPFLISWKRDGQDDFSEAQSHFSGVFKVEASCRAPLEETVLDWIGDRFKVLRIGPDPDRDTRPGPFRILEVVLLVPVDEQFGYSTGGDEEYGATFRSPRYAAFLGSVTRPVRVRNTLRVFLGDVMSGVHY